MGIRDCEWIGPRLPLWVDNGDAISSTDARGERSDLTAKERREIEQHLAGCARCRRHQLALEQALGALAIAANDSPIAPDAPSLWPLLEQRIIAGLAASGREHRPLLPGHSAGRSDQPWADLDSIRPLHRHGHTIHYSTWWLVEFSRRINRNNLPDYW